MTILRHGHGERGCFPNEFEWYLPDRVYFICGLCDHDWWISVSSFTTNPPTHCPECDEQTISGDYIIHDHQRFEQWAVPFLQQRKTDIQVASLQGSPYMDFPATDTISFGDPGLYTIQVYPYDRPLDPVPEFIKTVYLEDANDLNNDQYYIQNRLIVLIEDKRAWKRAIIKNYVVTNVIPDI